MFWADKYRPKQLQELDYHTTQAKQLDNLARNGDFPHLLVYGPMGAGKKTRIMCLLHELYGSGVEKLKLDVLTFTTPSKKKLGITTMASNYHIEVNPSDVGIYDRVVVTGVIKTVAQTQQLSVGVQKDFKVIIILDADRLSKSAQHALRRTMEKCVPTCRLILYATALSSIIAPVRSRCLAIRVPAPELSDISRILINVCQKQDVKISERLAIRIATAAERNLRRALLMCETYHVQSISGKLADDMEILPSDWETYIQSAVIKPMLGTQLVDNLIKIRTAIHELLLNNISADEIFKCILNGLMMKCDNEMMGQFVQQAAIYEYRAALGSKEIIHLEAFISRCMSIYQKVMQEFMDLDF